LTDRAQLIYPGVTHLGGRSIPAQPFSESGTPLASFAWFKRVLLRGKMRSVEKPDFLASTRDSYDRAAANYAEQFHRHLDDKPVDLAMVSAFAGLVSKGRNKRVIDVGCGTGATTVLMNGCGVDVSGIDLSPNMVFQARRLSPGVPFSVGSMTNLDAADESLGGICAWYSIIHVPDEHLPSVLGEFHRVLVPGGLALLAFQVGDTPRILTNAFGHNLHLTFIRRQPPWVRDQLVRAGFAVYAELVRQPDDDGLESTPQAYLIAQKCR
jgi:ubiquinone/menaquinone biosynthesis C-methylase UbiE